MISLTTKTKKRKSPKSLLVVGPPKVGKTLCCGMLPNAKLIDLQDGSSYYDKVDAFNIRLLTKENNERLTKEGKPKITKLDVFAEVCKHLKNDPPDYLIVDTVSDMEELAKDLALILYKASPMGKNYKGKDVTTLPQGAGYNWLRQAFVKLDDMIQECYKKGYIYTIHPKMASIHKEGQDLTARDINLTGKIKLYLCGEMHAIGFMHRDKGNPINFISFKGNERDLATGARPEHLRGKEFKISELKEDGTLETYWDQIYID